MYRNVVPVIGMTDISHFTPNGPVVQLGENKNLIQILYAGNYFKWQGIDLLFSTIEALMHEDFEFTVLGSVEKLPQLLERWKHVLKKHKKLHLIDFVDYRVVPQYYRGADIAVVPREFYVEYLPCFATKNSGLHGIRKCNCRDRSRSTSLGFRQFRSRGFYVNPLLQD